jgi:hypothetical protein
MYCKRFLRLLSRNFRYALPSTMARLLPLGGSRHRRSYSCRLRSPRRVGCPRTG